MMTMSCQHILLQGNMSQFLGLLQISRVWLRFSLQKTKPREQQLSATRYGADCNSRSVDFGIVIWRYSQLQSSTFPFETRVHLKVDQTDLVLDWIRRNKLNLGIIHTSSKPFNLKIKILSHTYLEVSPRPCDELCFNQGQGFLAQSPVQWNWYPCGMFCSSAGPSRQSCSSRPLIEAVNIKKKPHPPHITLCFHSYTLPHGTMQISASSLSYTQHAAIWWEEWGLLPALTEFSGASYTSAGLLRTCICGKGCDHFQQQWLEL